MRRMCVLAVVLAFVALLFAAALPAEAYHWHYVHPLWGLGAWPHFVGPLYPPVVYVPPPVVIQPPQPQQPQVYIQRPPEQPPQQFVWYWCQNPQGFWPHVQKCDNDAWMKVLPSTAPPSQTPR